MGIIATFASNKKNNQNNNNNVAGHKNTQADHLCVAQQQNYQNSNKQILGPYGNKNEI